MSEKKAAVTPTPFGVERAREIWAQRGSQHEVESKMTDGEKAYVKAVWDALPGESCWMTAFFLILNGLEKRAQRGGRKTAFDRALAEFVKNGHHHLASANAKLGQDPAELARDQKVDPAS